MKRLALVALLLCLAAPAHALGTGKLLVVLDEDPNICKTCTPDDAAITDTVRQATKGMIRKGWSNMQYLLDRYGVNYKVVSPYYIKTEEARIGAVTWNRGTSGAVTEEFDAVLHFSFDGSEPITTKSLRPDSLWRAARHAGATAVTNGQSVPAGYIFRPTPHGTTAWQNSAVGKGNAIFASQATSAATRCSLATQGTWDGPDAEDVGPSALPSVHRSPTTGRVWLSSANMMAPHLDMAAAGGVVPLVQAIKTTVARDHYPSSGAQPLRPDSIMSGGGGQTVEELQTDTTAFVSMWERRYSTIPNGSSVYGTPVNVCAFYWGAYPCADTVTSYSGSGLGSAAGAGSAANVPCEGDPAILMFMFARLNSLTGGLLIDRSRAPMRVAPLVYGGFSRVGSRRNPVGLFPADSTSLWNTLDSLKAEGIPLTVIANVDSIQSYASEIAQWKKVQVKFIPGTRYGLDSSIAFPSGSGASSPTRIADLWGTYRSRILYGDAGYGSALDTSLYAGIRYLRDTLSRQVGSPYVSRSAIAAFRDDYSPKNAGSITNFTDSLAFVLNKLGIFTLVTDAQVRDIGKVAATSRIGWWPYQGSLRTSSPAGNLRLLGHTGYSISGGAFQNDYGNDSTTFFQQTCCDGWSSAPKSAKEVNRWMTGALGPENYKDYDYWPSDGRSTSYADYAYAGVNVSFNDYIYPFQRAHVLRLGPNDLAGSTTLPVRPAYFALKSLNNCFNAINKMAGRVLVTLSTLDEANP